MHSAELAASWVLFQVTTTSCISRDIPVIFVYFVVSRVTRVSRRSKVWVRLSECTYTSTSSEPTQSGCRVSQLFNTIQRLQSQDPAGLARSIAKAFPAGTTLWQTTAWQESRVVRMRKNFLEERRGSKITQVFLSNYFCKVTTRIAVGRVHLYTTIRIPLRLGHTISYLCKEVTSYTTNATLRQISIIYPPDV